MRLRVVGKIGTLATLLLAVVALAGTFWITTTTEGARWLLTSALPLSGVSVTVRKIDGRIIDHLRLTEVRANLARYTLEVDTLELHWKPFLLLSGTAAVQDLSISRVRIQDDTPPDNRPPDFTWPRASANSQLFDCRIARLQVTNLEYRRLQEQPVLVTSITGAVTWQDGTLSVANLTGASPSGQISGSFSAGFKQPSLTSDLAIVLPRPVAEMDRLALQVQPGTAVNREPFAGMVTVTGAAGTHTRLKLGGEVGMTRNAFNLRRLLLTGPGYKGQLTGAGSLSFATGEPVLTAEITATGLDLVRELNVPTDLSGTLRFAGTPDNYRGSISLSNTARGWQAATVSAEYHGTRNGVIIAPLTGSLLDGSLVGNLDINWQGGFKLQGTVNGRNLNPAGVAADWKGVANFSATGAVAWPEDNSPTGNISGVLLESSLHGQNLTGELQAAFSGDNLSLTRLALHGKGFDIEAAGDLTQRLTLAARISDLSRLVPEAAGTLEANGWLRRRDGHLSGAGTGTGTSLAYAGTRAGSATVTARLDHSTGSPLHATASLRDVAHGDYTLDALTVAADGSLARHTVAATLRAGSSDARLALTAGYTDGTWQGECTALSGRDAAGPWHMTAPTAFSAGSKRVSLSPLTLVSGTSEQLEASADLTLSPLTGQVRAKWAGLNLTRANSYLQDVQITGNSSGEARLGFLPGERLTLAGSARSSGTVTRQGTSMTLLRSLLTFAGGNEGLRIGVELDTADGAGLTGTFSSPAPLGMAVPETGDLAVKLSGIDLALLKPWLPPGTTLTGHISGQANGKMLPGHRFELNGTASLPGGTVQRRGPDGELDLAVKSASVSWGWRDEELTGSLALAMSEYGEIRGNFRLPLPARFPVTVNQNGPLRASVTGRFREKGLITALFPGLVQESFGDISAKLDTGGTWHEPILGGTLQLAKAGAYLPTAGIHVKDVQLAARLEKNLIRIDSFRAVSGPGYIEGSALLTLNGWRVAAYRGTIGGKDFQTVYFPELQLLCTPKLSFEGTPEKLTLRGELLLPELDIAGVQSRTVITPSSDVIREGKTAEVAKTSPLALDVQVRLLLGEKVHVKVAGIDARLGGAMNVSLSDLDRITSSGEINVVKGRYRTYGVDLEIVRGRLFFAGVPIDLPSLDFLALRTIGDIRAGVTVTGTLQKPVTRLYSEPPMPDVDILAYIVLGHPLGSSGEQTGLLAQAAGALLTSGQGAVLQEQLQNYFGLSTLEIQGGVGGTKSPMGYKPLPVTAPGAVPSAQQPGVTETVLTVGKYLTPELYISYGKSLFTGSSQFLLRYDIFKKWQIETQTGSESGADLFYKLEFK